jgi:hypothetical protein
VDWIKRGLAACLLAAAWPVAGAELILGIALRDSDISVQDADSGRELARVSDKQRVVPQFVLKTRDRHFGESSFGWFVDFGEGYVRGDRQRDVDLGTTLSAVYWQLTPTVFYDFNRGAPVDASHFRAGFGLGLGYMDISGDVILTNEPGQPRRTYKEEKYTYSLGIFLEYSKSDWLFQIKHYGPQARSDGVRFSSENLTLVFGRRFNITD